MIETNVFKFLWKYTSKLKTLFISLFLLILLGELFLQLSLYFAAQIVEVLSSSENKDLILDSAVFFALLATFLLFCRAFFSNAMVFLEARFLPLFISKISKDLFIYAHKHSTAFFDEEMAGNISAKITTITANIQNIYYQTVWGFISPLFAISISFFFFFKINITLAFCMLGLNIFLIVLLWFLSKYLAPFSQRRAKAYSEANGILVDSITNASLVKSFSSFYFEKKHYFSFIKRAVIADRIETLRFGKLYIWQNLICSFIQSFFYLIPLWFWYKDKISLGDYVLISSLVLSLSEIYRIISHTFLSYFKNFGAISDGLRLLAIPYEVEDKPKAFQLSIQNPTIQFENVRFHYKGKKALFDNFNLIIQAGEKVGLVGHSGSGKSSLIKLLTRTYDIQDGKILISGQNIADVTQASLRKNIALIPQDPTLFNRTIMENIRYGNLKATDEEVYEAAQKAFCHHFILNLPHGYQSKVGERGVMLSGGERQRIAIARAILKNAPILILDEATSALDSQSEKYIQQSLKELMRGKTVIAIAHRLSTLREMNRLIVLDKGKIVEEGTHRVLLTQNGAYAQFYQIQSSSSIES